jgi:cytidine deaminase
MKKIVLENTATIYNNLLELEEAEQILIEKATKAKSNSYAPYSNFKVGAAILLENGVIVTGNNQENAAYPSGMCAERVAIWKVGSQFPNQKILKLAIVASSANKVVDKPVGPCGACRQTLSEYETKQNSHFEVLFMGEIGSIVKVGSIQSLLPFSFDSSYL